MGPNWFDDAGFEPTKFPFSEEEIALAIRVTTATASEATELAAEIFAMQRQQDREMADYARNQEEMDRRAAETNEGPAFGWLLSVDLLAIISLINSQLEERVERYLDWLHRGKRLDQQLWVARREQLRPWVSQRLLDIRSDRE